MPRAVCRIHRYVKRYLTCVHGSVAACADRQSDFRKNGGSQSASHTLPAPCVQRASYELNSRPTRDRRSRKQYGSYRTHGTCRLDLSTFIVVLRTAGIGLLSSLRFHCYIGESLSFTTADKLRLPYPQREQMALLSTPICISVSSHLACTCPVHRKVKSSIWPIADTLFSARKRLRLCFRR